MGEGITTGANVCRKVEGLVEDRRISRKVKGKLMCFAQVRLQHIYDPDTMAMANKQQ